MFQPFIRNHQYNLIKKQAAYLQHVSKTVADVKVIEAVRYDAESKVLDMFPDIIDLQKQLLQKISAVNKAEELEQYLRSIEPYVMEFPQVTEKKLKELFPKNKKLRLPDLSGFDFRKMTYLSWVDISTNKFIMVYPRKTAFVGFEGKYNPLNKKDICSICKRYGEVALVTATSQPRPANASPDYYKAVGNYMCTDSTECNRNITDITFLEKFIRTITD